MRRRFNRFGRHRPSYSMKPAVMESTPILASKKKCKACGLYVAAGETALRLRLRSQFRGPCQSCGTQPKGVKYFHTACRPLDLNKAMGYDPNAGQAPFTPPPQQPVAPPPAAAPPKPKTAAEQTIEALGMLEAALIAQLKQRKVTLTPEMDASFRKFQGMKSHVLRGANAHEELNATKLALKRIIDIAWN